MMIQPQNVQNARLKWVTTHIFGKQIAKRLLAPPLLAPTPPSDMSPPVFQVEKRKDLSLSEFKRIYLAQGIPVIFQGAAKHWPCVKKWSLEWLAQNYSQDEIHLIDAAPENIYEVHYEIEQKSLGQVLTDLKKDPIKNYSRFNRILYQHPELQADLDLPWLLQHRNAFASGKTFQVFIGGAGSKTHLHAAAEHNLFTQVYGKKAWVLYPPSYDGVLRPPVNRTPYFHSPFDPDAPDWNHFPEMQFLPRWECVLEPGDILFNPPSWWHHVNNPTDSIGVGFRWFSTQAFKLDWCQALLTLLAVNPPIWTATLNRDNFPRIFSSMQRKQNRGSL